ncbi:MAG: ribonucleotide reductase N-terminal alpha domain-containing protein, partial [Steroidobacteraceae bacterium]
MSTAVRIERREIDEIPFQEASLDIWDRKYRLTAKDGTPIDATMDDTLARVARTLADVEEPGQREALYERFLWALRKGAIPAGRIMSNAGALAHKPATSTINCTVSGTIRDSMDDILNKVHEAGLTLKAGCGIGYEFSTLRPRGAYVAGAGAHTSGPMSFMDIYDRMCFTVSSAGGRRGAQMGTFDVGHPDTIDFIRAKRENGRLRQFNLSLLVTDEFIEAVRGDRDWKLAFPLPQREYDPEKHDLRDPTAFVWREWPDGEGYVSNEEGLVACRIYKTVPARRLWDVIMASTYDFAEPGFVLIDRVNEMNNNWWCENIRATNPCVTADTWIHTAEGPRQVADLVDRPFVARVDGRDYASSPQGFFRTATRPVMRVETAEGYSLRLTADHRLRRVTGFVAGAPQSEWCAAGELRAGDRLLLNDHRSASNWAGPYTREQGYLAGLLIGAGTLEEDKAVLSAWLPALAVNAREEVAAVGVRAVMDAAFEA